MHRSRISTEDITTISDIFADSMDFDQQEVTVKGVIVTEGPEGSWFTVKEDDVALYVDLEKADFTISDMVGTTVVAYGRIDVYHMQPRLYDIGLKFVKK